MVAAGAAAWAVWSYTTGGLIRVLFVPSADTSTLDAVRAYVLGWGPWAPVVYVVAVVIEVTIAPIPGTLLYAPAGAIFGWFLGGTLSLIGNVLGAAISCWLAGTFGRAWIARRSGAGTLARIHERLKDRGGWVVFLLQVNPLTSSDLVAYAAGLAGIPVRRVVFGTIFGMAPQCYAQAYLAQTLFKFLPRGPWLIVAGGLIAVLIGVVAWRSIRGQERSGDPSPRAGPERSSKV